MTCITITWRSLAVAALFTIGLAIGVLNVAYPVDLSTFSFAFIAAACTVAMRGAVKKAAADWMTAYDAGRSVTTEGEAKVRSLR